MHLSADDLALLSFGEWVSCSSDFVIEAKYDEAANALVLGLSGKDGETTYYEYHGLPYNMLEDFAADASQGKWAIANLIRAKWPCTKTHR
jgi:hypothetical protein